nr:MAG TPA: hypothetical protein [Caudoviricetes sp.]
MLLLYCTRFVYLCQPLFVIFLLFFFTFRVYLY